MKKSTKKRRSTVGFPWKTGCFLLLLVIGAVVIVDTQKHGSFEATSTGKFMRESGITAFVQKILVSTKLYSAKGLEYLESTSPEYYKAVVDFSKPYVKLSGDFYLVGRNLSVKLYDNVSTYVAANVPKIQASVEHYIPGLVDSVKKNSQKGLEISKMYFAWIAEQFIENSIKATGWLKTNVFVGKLSPESLQSYTSQAINTTYTFASQTYDWVYEKVQTLSKAE